MTTKELNRTDQQIVGCAQLSRDDVRAAFRDSGLSREDVTLGRLELLLSCINEQMIESGLIDGTLKCHGKTEFSQRRVNCMSRYFSGREAVTFNEDGFVGFAGWADDDNVQPVLRGFLEWLDLVTT